VAQEVDGGLSKDTLLENLENLAQVTAVGGCAAAGDEDVVQIDEGDWQATKHRTPPETGGGERSPNPHWAARRVLPPE
jgi:hypothetical protein